MTQERTAPITSTPAAPSAPPGLRLRLDPGLARQGVVDGAWWPHSRDPSAELPELIAGLDAQLGAITRVALNLDAWASAPRRLTVAGRTVRVGSFRAIDAHTVSVRSIPRERVVLLVVPPEATTAAAAIAMAMATDATDSARPADILAASGITAEMPPTATPPGTPGPGVGAAGSSRRAPGSSGAPTRIAPGGVSVQGNGAHSQSHQSRAAGR
jgi:hypothetical protein